MIHILYVVTAFVLINSELGSDTSINHKGMYSRDNASDSVYNRVIIRYCHNQMVIESTAFNTAFMIDVSDPSSELIRTNAVTTYSICITYYLTIG